MLAVDGGLPACAAAEGKVTATVIQGLDNVGLAVRDVAAAAAWYAHFGLIREWGDETRAWLTAPGIQVYVFRTSGVAASAPRGVDLEGNPPGLDHLSFAVADVDAACAALSAAGIMPERPPRDYDWDARAAPFRDPDGNVVWLLQRK